VTAPDHGVDGVGRVVLALLMHGERVPSARTCRRDGGVLEADRRAVERPDHRDDARRATGARVRRSAPGGELGLVARGALLGADEVVVRDAIGGRDLCGGRRRERRTIGVAAARQRSGGATAEERERRDAKRDENAGADDEEPAAARGARRRRLPRRRGGGLR
jgi:hypothetical protein